MFLQGGKKQKLAADQLGSYAGFSVTRSGEVRDVFYDKNKDDDRILSLKKGIIQSFQTKFKGYSRTETTPQGKVRTHYKQKVLKDKTILIKSSRSQEDTLEHADKRQKKKDGVSSYTGFLVLTVDGYPKTIVTKEDSTPGGQSENRKKAYAKNKNQIGFHADAHAAEVPSDAMGSKSSTHLSLEEIIPKKRKVNTNLQLQF